MPLSLNHSSGPLQDADADAMAVLVSSDADQRRQTLEPLSQALGSDLEAALDAVDVSGKSGEVARIPINGRLLLVAGIGSDSDNESLRSAAARAVRNAPKNGSLAIAATGDGDGVRAVAEGAGLGAYAYTEHRKKPHEVPSLTGLTVVSDSEGAAQAVARAQVVVDAVSAARDMVNTPPAQKRPPTLAQTMADLVADSDVAVTIFDEQQLSDGGFGGILGVGAGSSEPPRLVELVYEPDGWSTHVVLVGKGITFDSGGLSLKSWKGMLTMKSDMAGAAAVAATLSACKDAGITAKVTGLCALAENMPSGTATRPSDVLVHRGGTTVEVLNTDAEGRLVLADALAYAAEADPDVIIDLATLTGAQVVALGDDVAAILGTDQGLINDLQSAGVVAGEQLWPLPLVEAYAETLKSPVADLKNIGKAGHAGTITAALFLRHFTDGKPWAHLDIAGPSFRDSANDSYLPAGATGFGVRTLLAYLTDL